MTTKSLTYSVEVAVCGIATLQSNISYSKRSTIQLVLGRRCYVYALTVTHISLYELGLGQEPKYVRQNPKLVLPKICGLKTSKEWGRAFALLFMERSNCKISRPCDAMRSAMAQDQLQAANDIS